VEFELESSAKKGAKRFLRKNKRVRQTQKILATRAWQWWGVAVATVANSKVFAKRQRRQSLRVRTADGLL